MQQFSPDKYKGKRVQYSAFVKSEGAQWAALWMRVDKGERSFILDNMRDRPIKGTTDWKRYEVVLDVPQAATAISFGVLLSGSGTVWLNGVGFDVVGSDVPTTGKAGPDKPKLGFEN